MQIEKVYVKNKICDKKIKIKDGCLRGQTCRTPKISHYYKRFSWPLYLGTTIKYFKIKEKYKLEEALSSRPPFTTPLAKVIPNQTPKITPNTSRKINKVANWSKNVCHITHQ